MRILGTGLSGGILGDALMPELTKAGQDRYKAELAAYAGEAEAYTMAQALASIDPSEITPAHIALGTEYGGTKFGEYLTDQYAAQQAEVGTDHAVAELAGVPYAQWVQRSPEQKRADRNYYQSKSGDSTYFDAQLEAQGKSPEQLQNTQGEGGYGRQGSADRDDRYTQAIKGRTKGPMLATQTAILYGS